MSAAASKRIAGPLGVSVAKRARRQQRPSEESESRPAAGFLASVNRVRVPGVQRQPERGLLGVSADRPLSSGMYHATAKRLYPLERHMKVADREIRQRQRVARSRPSSVHADDGSSAPRLPSLTFSARASLERRAQEL